MKEVVRVWIGKPYEEGRFNGTAFFIDAQTLVTAKHVVSNREGKVYENIFLGNTPDGGIIPIDSVKLCERDLAILTVKKSFVVTPNLFTKEIQEGNDVVLIGFYDNSSSQKTYENRISGYQSSEHTYELQNHLTNGLSGSPVFFNNKICGVAKAINIQKNLTYVIPITELCMEIAIFFKEKEQATKKLSLEQWASMATIGATLIALGSLIFSLEVKTEDDDPKPKIIIERELSKQMLEGVVRDEGGNVLEGVDVWERKTGNLIETNKEGYYSFKNIEGEVSETTEVKFNKRGYYELTEQQILGEKYDVLLQQKVD